MFHFKGTKVHHANKKSLSYWEFEFPGDENLTNASQSAFDSESWLRTKYWHQKPGDVVFDVGAGFGAYTILALAQQATVWSLEPHPILSRALSHNISLNGFPSINVRLNTKFPWGNTPSVVGEFGLWDQTVDLMLPHGTASAVPLDYLCRIAKVPRVDWIKIDAEGAELAILKGANDSLLAYKPKLLLEVHKFMDAQMEQKLRDFLCDYNYQFELYPYDAHVDHLFCW
jgi:FkbM family methyltransferase